MCRIVLRSLRGFLSTECTEGSRVPEITKDHCKSSVKLRELCCLKYMGSFITT